MSNYKGQMPPPNPAPVAEATAACSAAAAWGAAATSRAAAASGGIAPKRVTAIVILGLAGGGAFSPGAPCGVTANYSIIPEMLSPTVILGSNNGTFTNFASDYPVFQYGTLIGGESSNYLVTVTFGQLTGIDHEYTINVPYGTRYSYVFPANIYNQTSTRWAFTSAILPSNEKNLCQIIPSSPNNQSGNVNLTYSCVLEVSYYKT